MVTCFDDNIRAHERSNIMTGLYAKFAQNPAQGNTTWRIQLLIEVKAKAQKWPRQDVPPVVGILRKINTTTIDNASESPKETVIERVKAKNDG